MKMGIAQLTCLPLLDLGLFIPMSPLLKDPERTSYIGITAH